MTDEDYDRMQQRIEDLEEAARDARAHNMASALVINAISVLLKTTNPDYYRTMLGAIQITLGSLDELNDGAKVKDEINRLIDFDGVEGA